MSFEVIDEYIREMEEEKREAKEEGKRQEERELETVLELSTDSLTIQKRIHCLEARRDCARVFLERLVRCMDDLDAMLGQYTAARVRYACETRSELSRI